MYNKKDIASRGFCHQGNCGREIFFVMSIPEDLENRKQFKGELKKINTRFQRDSLGTLILIFAWQEYVVNTCSWKGSYRNITTVIFKQAVTSPILLLVSPFTVYKHVCDFSNTFTWKLTFFEGHFFFIFQFFVRFWMNTIFNSNCSKL